MSSYNNVEKNRAFPSQEYSVWAPAADQMDQEIKWSSAEMVEPPPEWVAEVVVGKLKRTRSVKVQAHNQILRIRAEDSHLGEDKFGVAQFMVFSKPLLPASPLSGRAAY